MKRRACFQRQTGACRRCGPAACQPCRRAWGVGRNDRRISTDWWRTGRGVHSVLRVQRMRRSTPTGRLVPNGRSDQPRPSGGCPAAEAINPQAPDWVSSGRRAYHSNRRTWTEDEGPASTPSYQPALPAKDQRQTPHCQHSLVGDRGRANHPPVMPVQQGSRTQVSMVGNLGKSLTARSLSTARDPQKRACGPPFANRRQIVH